MIVTETIAQVVASQRGRLLDKELGQPRQIRDFGKLLAGLSSHALIVTGIRRCGKSTLMQQVHANFGKETIYLNFEDPRLAGFDLDDFNRLQNIAELGEVTAYFFDEIQNIAKWESFVRFRLDEGYTIFITGSNASILSKELGTKLTGRHISLELFPFSYIEYLEWFKLDASAESAAGYMRMGGFPEFLKTQLPEVLVQMFNDILIRDIAVRYHLKQHKVLQQLAVWLASNVGKPITGNSLRKSFDIASSSTISEYLSYFTDAYLFFFLPKYNTSVKAQLVNPKKVYCIDNGFIEVNSLSANADNGRLLENMVFMQLRRTTQEIFYFADKRECDFVVFEKRKPKFVLQVCWQLNEDNLVRELQGLQEAMLFFGLNQGFIITHNQVDTFKVESGTVEAIPFYRWGGG
jgi:predicted AAA+ superfamily ATPase